MLLADVFDLLASRQKRRARSCREHNSRQSAPLHFPDRDSTLQSHETVRHSAETSQTVSEQLLALAALAAAVSATVEAWSSSGYGCCAGGARTSRSVGGSDTTCRRWTDRGDPFGAAAPALRLRRADTDRLPHSFPFPPPTRPYPRNYDTSPAIGNGMSDCLGCGVRMSGDAGGYSSPYQPLPYGSKNDGACGVDPLAATDSGPAVSAEAALPAAPVSGGRDVTADTVGDEDRGGHQVSLCDADDDDGRVALRNPAARVVVDASAGD